jgi:two-component system, sensor histidine kinase
MTELSSVVYRNLLEFAPDALLLVNNKGIIIYANATAHSLFGYTAGSLQGATIEQLIPEQARAKHVALRGAFIADPSTREMGNRRMPLFGQRRDGSVFRAEIRLAAIHTSDGIVSAAAVRDATESERIVTMLAAAKDFADEANATKGRFLAAASHDLRQPLQTLRLLNGSLKRLTHDPLTLEVLDQEERALGRMSELLNALLNVTKLESGTVQPTISEVSLAELFDDLQQQFASPAKFKKLKLKIVHTDIALRTDSTLLLEMVQNLLANAIRYTDAGRVVLRCRVDNSGTWVDVEDTGVGIPSDVLQNIFDDFFQATTPSAPHRGGVGLGLAIVRRLSQMLGFPVAVSSTVNEGTRFSVDVTSAVCEPTTRLAVAKLVQQFPKRGQRVVLVEDDASMRAALCTYLQLDNHTVQTAGSLSDLDSLLVVMEQPPDIVISDFHLGESECGSEAIERIRAKFGNQVPAIILTGDTSLIPTQLGKQPITRMLNKPIDVHMLMATMEDLLTQGGH